MVSEFEDFLKSATPSNPPVDKDLDDAIEDLDEYNQRFARDAPRSGDFQTRKVEPKSEESHCSKEGM